MEEARWEVRPVARWAGSACIIAGLGTPLAVSVYSFATMGWRGATALPSFILGGLFALGGWRLALVPQIAAAESGIVVDNPFGRTIVPWDDVADVVPGYAGLIIRRRDGRAVTAWAVQKANASKWMHRRTRADEVAEGLLRMADERRPTGARSGLRLDTSASAGD